MLFVYPPRGFFHEKEYRIKSISVVLPVYNEEANISEVVQSIADFLPRVTSDFEIIAVNDGSTDETAKRLESLKSANPYLKSIHHLKNKGYGAALISGFKNSQKDLILMMDADRQFNIAELSKLFLYIEDFDIAAGFRIKRKDPWYRYVLGVFFNLLANIVFGIKTKDINCGFKLFKGDLIREMDLVSDGALINTEIIARALGMGARIKEAGVEHYPRLYGRQTGANLDVVIKAVLEMFQLKAKIRVILKSPPLGWRGDEES